MSGLWLVPLVLAGLGVAAWAWWRRREKAPSNELLLSRTFTHLLEGNHDDVVERMRLLYEQTQHDVGIGLALGNLLRGLGKFRPAIRTHRSLVARNPAPEIQSLIQTELAADYLAAGLLNRAREALEQALALEKVDDLRARYGEEIYERLGEYEAAAKLLSGLAKQSPEHARRLALLRCRQAEAAWEEDRVKEANEALKKAFSADAACLPAFLLNARMLRESGKPDKARAYLGKHLADFGDATWQAMDEFRHIAVRDGRHDLFVDAAERRLTQVPDDWRTRMVLGEFLVQLGEYDQAADTLLEALTEAPRVLKLHQAMWSLILRAEGSEILARYRNRVKADLVFSRPYRCGACFHDSSRMLWRCPKCRQIYTYAERKI